MNPRRAAIIDAVLYGSSALVGAATSAWASIPLYRTWGIEAAVPYAGAAAAAAVVAAAVPTLGRRTYAVRVALAVAVLFGAGLSPMILQAVERSRASPGLHAQSEVIVIEEAARMLLEGRNPYSVSYASGPLEARSEGVQEHFPYMPGMLAFGLPRALDGEAAAADARPWFAATAIVLGIVALGASMADRERRLRAAQVLIVLPTGAAFMAGGAHVLPVLALLLLALVLLARARSLAAGIVLGIATATMQIAGALLPFLVAAAEGRRARLRVAVGWALPLLGALPFLLWDPSAFVADVVRYPLGLTEAGTTAEAPTLGRLLVASGTSRALLSLVVVGVLSAWVVLRLLRSVPSSAGAAAGEAAFLLALAILLAPAGRLGYWVFPANLLVWAWLLSGETGYPHRPEPATPKAAGR